MWYEGQKKSSERSILQPLEQSEFRHRAGKAESKYIVIWFLSANGKPNLIEGDWIDGPSVKSDRGQGAGSPFLLEFIASNN